MNRPNIFARITKVDVARQEVIGRAVQEVVDQVDEVFDYAGSKPHFEAWSKSFAEATAGASLGNIRAMHGKTAAGKVVEIDFNDAEKAIDIRTKIVDANEWAKVQEGVYTGFSIGGSYVGERIAEKIGDREVKRYIAKPSEISLVDNPCVPTAKFFDIIKADGTIEKVAFRPPELEVSGSDEDVAELARAMKAAGWSLSDVIKLIPDPDLVVMAMTTGQIEKLDDATRAALKREFTAEERKAAAKEGAALPDGSFPIKTVGDLENAIRAIGRAKNPAAAKAHIKARAKALGAEDKIPEAWKLATGAVAKGMWNVGSFANCLECVADIARSAQSDFDYEGDGSPVPAQLRNWLGDGITIFKSMAEEEANELLAQLKTAAGVGPDDDIEQAVEMAFRAGALRKALADPKLTLSGAMEIAKANGVTAQDVDAAIAKMVAGDTAVGAISAAIMAKAGARHSKVDSAHLQEAHDHLQAMGATCGGKQAAAPSSDLAKAHERIAALEATVLKISKQPAPHVMLRTVQKTDVPPAEPGTPAVDDLQLEPGDYIKNADGTIDFIASRINKAAKLRLAKP